MHNDKMVLISVLTERTGRSGRRYMSGFLGKAKIVAFPDGETEWGPTWKIYVSDAPPANDQPAKSERAVADLFNKPV